MQRAEVLEHAAGGGARVRIGPLEVDPLRFQEALAAISMLVECGQGGAVYTPNVDHVVLAEQDLGFRQAYAHASLSLADGMPLLWAARLLGTPLPDKVSGSDLLEPLMRRAAERRWRVYLLGSQPEVAERAEQRLRTEFGVDVVGRESPWVKDPGSAAERAPIVARIRQARPHLLVVSFGAPRQELWIHAARQELGPVVALGLGASVDFLAGSRKRAPRWLSRSGLEWLYRLGLEPRRLWRRYLLRDPRFALILLHALRERRRTSRDAAARRPARVSQRRDST